MGSHLDERPWSSVAEDRRHHDDIDYVGAKSRPFVREHTSLDCTPLRQVGEDHGAATLSRSRRRRRREFDDGACAGSGSVLVRDDPLAKLTSGYRFSASSRPMQLSSRTRRSAGAPSRTGSAATSHHPATSRFGGQLMAAAEESHMPGQLTSHGGVRYEYTVGSQGQVGAAGGLATNVGYIEGAARPVLVSMAVEVLIELALITMAILLWTEL